jgi:TRAP-type C4-dicarboxylate transport system substrate-binding protein
MEDLKGLKLRIIGGPPVESMKALGGVPVMIPAPDIYTSLEKGLIAGAGREWSLTDAFKVWEQLRYYTYVPLYVGYFNIVMNLDKWNSLPSDIQEQIMGECGFKGSQLWGRGRDLVKKAVKEKIAAGGYDMIEYTPPPEEQDRWLAVGGKPMWEKWVADMEAKGQPRAQEILDTLLELIETYKP